MARSIGVIYDQIIEEKQNKPALDGLLPADESSVDLLDDLTSDSKVAVWRLWAYIVALIIHTHEVMWDVFKIDIEAIVQAAATGTPRWYRDQVLKYQHGDSLVYLNQKYQYNPIDEDARIVKSCAINERSNGTIFIKVAKDDGSDGLTKLTTSEINALTSYVNKIKFAGAKTAVYTNDADLLTINYDLYYDPIVPLDTLISNIESAVKKHLSNLDFDGVLNVNKFTDVLQSVTGVADPVFTFGQSQVTGSSDITEFIIENQPGSGYFQLADTIENLFNFIPKL